MIAARQENEEEAVELAVSSSHPSKVRFEEIFRFLLLFANNWLINDPRQTTEQQQSCSSMSKREGAIQ